MNFNQIKIITDTMLKSEVPSDRYEAIIALGFCEKMFSIDSNEIDESIIYPYLKDEDDHVRYYCADALGYLNSKKSLTVLKSVLPVIDMGKSNKWIEENIKWAIFINETIDIEKLDDKSIIKIQYDLPVGSDGNKYIQYWLKYLKYKTDYLSKEEIIFDFSYLKYEFGDSITSLWIETKIKRNIKTKILASKETYNNLKSLIQNNGIECEIQES